MLDLRPIVVDEDMVVLGGNMRLKACIAAGLKEVPIKVAEGLTSEQKAEFIIKDNASFGEWDWDLLANEWDPTELIEWGIDVPFDSEPEESENEYTKKIDAPTYEPTGDKPDYAHLVDDDKTRKLIKEIEYTDITESDKEFLKLAAQRHLVFNYARIADFYAHSSKEVQELMEKSALVIIDFDDAIHEGYVELTKTLNEIFDQDYDGEQ